MKIYNNRHFNFHNLMVIKMTQGTPRLQLGPQKITSRVVVQIYNRFCGLLIDYEKEDSKFNSGEIRREGIQILTDHKFSWRESISSMNRNR